MKNTFFSPGMSWVVRVCRGWQGFLKCTAQSHLNPPPVWNLSPKKPTKNRPFWGWNLTPLEGLRQISLAFRQATKLQYPQSKELREGVRVLGLVGGGLANVFERPMRQLYWVCEAEAGQDGEMEEELWPPGLPIKKHKWAMCATVSGCTEGKTLAFFCYCTYLYIYTHTQDDEMLW